MEKMIVSSARRRTIVGREPSQRASYENLRVTQLRATASTSMKPGRVKRKIREDWFTLLFEVTRVRPTALVKVIRGLI